MVLSTPGLLAHQSEEYVASELLGLAAPAAVVHGNLPPLIPTEGDVIVHVFCLCSSLKGISCVFTSRSMFFFLHILCLLIILLLPVKPRQPQRQSQSPNSVKKKADWYPQRKDDQENCGTLGRHNGQAQGFSSDLEEMFTCIFFHCREYFYVFFCTIKSPCLALSTDFTGPFSDTA